ncbi:hypothetical protein AB1N83_009534 [Pleurotus pulmonarius]
MCHLIAVAIVAISALDFCSSANGRLWTFERFAVTHRLRFEISRSPSIWNTSDPLIGGLSMAKTNSLLRLSTPTNEPNKTRTLLGSPTTLGALLGARGARNHFLEYAKYCRPTSIVAAYC